MAIIALQDAIVGRGRAIAVAVHLVESGRAMRRDLARQVAKVGPHQAAAAGRTVGKVGDTTTISPERLIRLQRMPRRLGRLAQEGRARGPVRQEAPIRENEGRRGPQTVVTPPPTQALRRRQRRVAAKSEKGGKGRPPIAREGVKRRRGPLPMLLIAAPRAAAVQTVPIVPTAPQAMLALPTRQHRTLLGRLRGEKEGESRADKAAKSKEVATCQQSRAIPSPICLGRPVRRAAVVIGKSGTVAIGGQAVRSRGLRVDRIAYSGRVRQGPQMRAA